MDIHALCAQAKIALKSGGQDQWGHVYEADEIRFGFVLEQHVLCFRYRTCEGSSGWFVNVRLPGEERSSLVFTRISEVDVAQMVMFYIGRGQRMAPSVAPAPTRPGQQFLLFGS